MQIGKEVDIDGAPESDNTSCEFDESGSDEGAKCGSISPFEHSDHFDIIMNSIVVNEIIDRIDARTDPRHDPETSSCPTSRYTPARSSSGASSAPTA